jgi:hypothetical protein
MDAAIVDVPRRELPPDNAVDDYELVDVARGDRVGLSQLFSAPAGRSSSTTSCMAWLRPVGATGAWLLTIGPQSCGQDVGESV